MRTDETRVNLRIPTAEPDACLSNVRPAMRVGLLTLHTSSVAGAFPVVFWPNRRSWCRIGADGEPCGHAIRVETFEALVRYGLVEKAGSPHRQDGMRFERATLTQNGAWYARTIERQKKAEIARSAGMPMEAAYAV